jgi:signal transduction histidine kinase/ActR/RegA family two-component response regulator
MARSTASVFRALDRDADYFASVVDASPDCIRILDIDGRIEFMNAHGLALFEVEDFAVLEGQYWPGFWPAEFRPVIEAALEAARIGETRAFQGFCPTATGVIKWWDTVISPVFGPGRAEPVRLLVRSRDITETIAVEKALQEALDRAEAASQAKSDFLATMSHEIRTPLNGVLGMAQAMHAGELTAAQRERLKIIQRSGHSLLTILNDILDLSKIEAGALALETADFDLEHLVRGAAAAFLPPAEKKGVAFELTVEDPARAVFHGDANRIRRLLYTLLSNAVKFTPQGRIAIRAAHADGRLLLEVADTGVGIPTEKINSLFESFVQGDASNTRRFAGSGLGLSICQGLVELMDGAITVSSAVGVGSVFTVSLPLARVSEVAPMTAAPAEGEDLIIKVLAAEDNEVNQLVLMTLLQQVGIEPRMVADGAQALAAWEQEHWDLVLMDIQMPGMDGLSAARAIRARETATGRARTPIIAVTANAMTHQLRAYRDVGMDDVVAKPVVAQQLLSAMERALDGEPAVSAPMAVAV